MAKIFVVEREYQAKGDTHWFYVEREYQASVKIFWVDREYKADIKLFKVDRDYKAKWNKSNTWSNRLS